MSDIKDKLAQLSGMLDTSKTEYAPLMAALTQLVEASERGERFSREQPLIEQAKRAEVDYMHSDWSGVRQDTLWMFRPADMFIDDIAANKEPTPETYKQQHDDFLRKMGRHPDQAAENVALMMSGLTGGRPSIAKPSQYSTTPISKPVSPEPKTPAIIADALEALLPRLSMHELLKNEPLGSTETVQTKYGHQQKVAVPFYRNLRLLAQDLREHETSGNNDPQIHGRILLLKKLASDAANQEEYGVKTSLSELWAEARKHITITPADILEGLQQLESTIRTSAERNPFKKPEALELAESLKKLQQSLRDGNENALTVAVQSARSAMKSAPTHSSGSLGHIADDLDFYITQSEPKRGVGPKSEQEVNRPPRTMNRHEDS